MVLTHPSSLAQVATLERDEARLRARLTDLERGTAAQQAKKVRARCLLAQRTNLMLTAHGPRGSLGAGCISAACVRALVYLHPCGCYVGRRGWACGPRGPAAPREGSDAPMCLPMCVEVSGARVWGMGRCGRWLQKGRRHLHGRLVRIEWIS